MIKAAYCPKDLCLMLEAKGIHSTHVTQFEKGGGWYNKYTLDVAMRWLREEKYILIFIVPAKDNDGNLQYMADVLTWNEEEGLYEPSWCICEYVYEKSVEAAIRHCLENYIQ